MAIRESFVSEISVAPFGVAEVSNLRKFSPQKIVIVIATNPMFILPWVHEKFTFKFTMSNVDGCTIAYTIITVGNFGKVFNLVNW